MYNNSYLKFGDQDECFMWLRTDHAHKKYIYIYIQKGSCVYLYPLYCICLCRYLESMIGMEPTQCLQRSGSYLLGFQYILVCYFCKILE